jgi:hypothetical protein
VFFCFCIRYKFWMTVFSIGLWIAMNIYISIWIIQIRVSGFLCAAKHGALFLLTRKGQRLESKKPSTIPNNLRESIFKLSDADIIAGDLATALSDMLVHFESLQQAGRLIIARRDPWWHCVPPPCSWVQLCPSCFIKLFHCLWTRSPHHALPYNFQNAASRRPHRRTDVPNANRPGRSMIITYDLWPYMYLIWERHSWQAIISCHKQRRARED